MRDQHLAHQVDEARRALNDALRAAWAADLMTEVSISRFKGEGFGLNQVNVVVYREILPVEPPSALSDRIARAFNGGS